MKKEIILVSIIVAIGLVVLLSGCIENNDSKDKGGSTEAKTVTMNAQEFGEDMGFEQPSETVFKTYFKSLDDGDTLIFQDLISDITYDETTDITTIEFEYSQGEGEGTYTSTNEFIFDGNLTGDYSVGDEVRITVTIKHVTFTMQGMTLDIEVYEEYWVSEQYYIDNYMTGMPFKPISAEKITKV